MAAKLANMPVGRNWSNSENLPNKISPFESTRKTIYRCQDCSEVFDMVVWHCRNCAHHWPVRVKECRNCHKGFESQCKKVIEDKTTDLPTYISQLQAAKLLNVSDRTHELMTRPAIRWSEIRATRPRSSS